MDGKGVTEVIVRGKKGEFEALPERRSGMIIFHPIPRSCQGLVQEGELWEGRYGLLRETGKRDCYGKTIAFQFFIPVTRVEEWKVVPDLDNSGIGKLLLTSGDVVLSEQDISPAYWKWSSWKTGYTFYPVWRSPDGQEVVGSGRRLPPERIKECFSAEEAEKIFLFVNKIEEDRKRAHEEWVKKNRVVRELPDYWYCPYVSFPLPEVGSFYWCSGRNADEEFHVFVGGDWRVVACDDNVILCGEPSDEANNFFELVCFYRWVMIQRAHHWPVKSIGEMSLGEYFDGLLSFLGLKSVEGNLDELLLPVKRYLFSNKKEDDELVRWADSLIFGNNSFLAEYSRIVGLP